jgi:hypothetical protein
VRGCKPCAFEASNSIARFHSIFDASITSVASSFNRPPQKLETDAMMTIIQTDLRYIGHDAQGSRR